MPAPPVSRKLLNSQYPLIMLPELAAAIGTDEAIMLQQIHYWLSISGKERDGRVWIYNSYRDWTRQMPFWSKSKIGRLVNRLRALGLIQIGNYNAHDCDHTFWYSIDYAAVAALIPVVLLPPDVPPLGDAPALAAAPAASDSVRAIPGDTETPRSSSETPRSSSETPRSSSETPRSSSETPRSRTGTTIPETNTETNTETNAERERGPSAPPPPTVESLTIDDGLSAWLAAECAAAGVPASAIAVARETATWRDDHRRKGTAPADPAADWRIWMRRAIAYARRHPPPPEVPHDTGPGPTRLVVGTIGAPPPGAPAADAGDAAPDFLAALRAAARARGVPC